MSDRKYRHKGYQDGGGYSSHGSGSEQRPQGPRRRHELVHADTGRDGEEREQPPAAEPQHAEHERQADRRDQEAGSEVGHESEAGDVIDRRIYGAGSRTPRSRSGARPARSRARGCR